MNEHSEIDFCLLIPCYNNFTGLIISLRSVEYDRQRMIVVVIDDGSTEPITKERILQELGTTLQVVVLTNDRNSGITLSLNKGLHWILENTRAKYIARLDCGDTCAPDRFLLQVAFLENDPGIGLLGSWCRFTEKGTGFTYVYKTPLQQEEIVREMYNRNVFIHPTVMFRAGLVEKAGYYPTGFPYTEDYAFFWKLMLLSRTAVVDKILVVCEFNRHGISYTNRNKQILARKRVVKRFGSNNWLKWKGVLRLDLLFLLPKWLSLRLKQRKK